VAILSTAAGAVDVSRTDWRKALINLVLMSASAFLVAIVIEEDARADGSALPNGSEDWALVF
jgi:hypothetical protein